MLNVYLFNFIVYIIVLNGNLFWILIRVCFHQIGSLVSEMSYLVLSRSRTYLVYLAFILSFSVYKPVHFPNSSLVNQIPYSQIIGTIIFSFFQ
uniref:Uncharacterized protein n=1 Tax=Rhizophora mucronata TaxID=61149 RepID=A0A2P2NNR1_RHIMU